MVDENLIGRLKTFDERLALIEEHSTSPWLDDEGWGGESSERHEWDVCKSLAESINIRGLAAAAEKEHVKHVMVATRGSANPKCVYKILEELKNGKESKRSD